MNLVFNTGHAPVPRDPHLAFDDAFPDRATFDGLLPRWVFHALNLHAQDCLFIDDTPANPAGAEAADLQALPFTGVENLRHSLTRRGLL